MSAVRCSARVLAQEEICRRRFTTEAARQDLPVLSSSVERSVRPSRPVRSAQRGTSHRRRLRARQRFKSVCLSVSGKLQPSHAFVQPQSTRSFQAPAMQLALPALVCFAIQVKTQIQGTAVAQRAWPNPSIERTRNGMAHLAFISFWAKRAMPLRSAHVKR